MVFGQDSGTNLVEDTAGRPAEGGNPHTPGGVRRTHAVGGIPAGGNHHVQGTVEGGTAGEGTPEPVGGTPGRVHPS